MIDQFYADILPEGQHVVATLGEGNIKHYAVNSTAEVIPCLSKFPDLNTYHSVGAYQGLKAGELHEVKDLPGCTGARAFGFDLDVGDDNKKYDSLEEAFTCLAKAVEQGHCPEPTWTMYSGGGLQFYLVLGGKSYDQGLSEKLWSTCFLTIRSHLRQHLKIDPTVGSRPYRLLRSPCTANWKYEEPVMPQILNDAKGPYITAEWIKSLKPAKAPTVTADSGQHKVERPVAVKRLTRACAAMDQMLKSGGKDVLEPEWFAAANICAHTFGYRKLFHKMSSGHADYTPGDTDAKFNHVTQSAASGPMGCEYFGDPKDPESPCHGCWAAKQGLSNPISAARAFGKEPPKLPKEKKGTEIESSLDEVADEIEDSGMGVTASGETTTYGIIEGQLPEDFSTDGDWITGPKGVICRHFLVKPFQFNDHSDVGNVLFSLNGENWHPLAARKLSTPASTVGELMNCGVMVYDDNKTLEYIRQAAMTRQHMKEFSSFGWSPEFTSAYVPTGPVGPTSSEPAAGLMRICKDWGSVKGDLDTWIEAVQPYARKGQEPYLMALLAAIASPLLSFYQLDQKGVILSLTGIGGAGKTSALKAGATAWGKDISSLAGTASTPVALRVMLSQCGHMPMLFDDITQMAAEDLKQLALEISQGQGRARGKVDGTLQAMETWQLVFLTTSNTSLHTKLAELIDQGSADMNRVIEVPVSQSTHVSPLQGKHMMDTLQDNHGHIGPAFLEHLLTLDRTEEIKKFRSLQDKLRARDGLKGSDRFVDSLICVCYMAHKILKQMYPKFPGDAEDMFLWMRGQLRQNNRNIESVLSIRVPEVDDFIMSYAVEDLIVFPSGKGYTKQGNSLKGYIYDHNEFYLVPRDVFNGWCRRNNLQPRTVIENWGFNGRLVNQASPGNANRWSGKFKDGILLDGIKAYPNVIIMRKNHADIKAQTDSGSGNVTPINKTATPYR